MSSSLLFVLTVTTYPQIATAAATKCMQRSGSDRNKWFFSLSKMRLRYPTSSSSVQPREQHRGDRATEAFRKER